MSRSVPALSTPRLLVAIIFISIFTMAVRLPADTDTWWHLSSGRYIFEQGSLYLADPFSHTRLGVNWIYPKGGHIFWYGIFLAGGWPALSLTLAGLVTLAFWFTWKQVDNANVFVTGFAMILGAIVSSVVWVARPQIISFLMTAIAAYLLHRFKRHHQPLLPWFPLMMLLWANIHGGFAIGFMLIVAYLAGETTNRLTKHTADPVLSWSQLKYLLVVTGLSLAAVAVNPYTWQMWLYPFQTVGIGALRDFIQEWQSPDFHLPYVQPFAVMLLLILVVMARSERQADWTDLALVGMWALWALFAARNIAIFGLVSAPILARYGDEVWTRQWQAWGYRQPPFGKSLPVTKLSGPRLILNWVLLGLLCLAALVKISVPLLPDTRLKEEQQSLPYQAVTFLEENRPPGPLFNSYNWGGYLIFRLWPEYPVYIDGRTDLYDDAFIRRYLSVMLAEEGWQQALDADGINLILIESNSVLDKFLRRETGWVELYRDDMAVVFGRSDD